MSGKFQNVIEAIDRENRTDPREVVYEGQTCAYEWVYSQRMRRCLGRLCPDASELLQIAAYGQHIKRWQIPRATYPEGKAGYYAWRNRLKAFHGDEVARIMAACGYRAEEGERVKTLLSKKLLGSDLETETLEDVICLVFLEDYFSDFAAEYSDDKLGVIVRKTWAKMSPRGQSAALSLPLEPESLRRIEKALS